MRFTIWSTILLITTYSFGQNVTDAYNALSNVNSIQDVQKLKESHPEWTVSIEKNAEIGMTYDSILVNMDLSDTTTKRMPNGQKRLYKVIEKTDEELCYVQYIYIDGRNRPKEKVKSLQKMIISQYRAGKSFTSLNEKFSEDANPDGILNWFYKGMMVNEFDTAVRGKPSNSVFMIDIPAYHWHYVVLKKDEDKMAEVTTSVSILITE